METLETTSSPFQTICTSPNVLCNLVILSLITFSSLGLFLSVGPLSPVSPNPTNSSPFLQIHSFIFSRKHLLTLPGPPRDYIWMPFLIRMFHITLYRDIIPNTLYHKNESSALDYKLFCKQLLCLI